MSFMPSLARQGRKKSPMANSKRHPGGQQFANCEWGYPFCRRQSSFLANIPWYFSPPGGHISFHLVHFGWQASSSLRNLRGITVSSSSYTTRWQPFSSRILYYLRYYNVIVSNRRILRTEILILLGLFLLTSNSAINCISANGF